MTIGDRVKIVRKNADLTQVDFGARIGVKQTAIGQIETGTRNLTDRNADAICREFSIRKEWLMSGVGEMIELSDDAEIAQLVERYHLRSLEKSALESFVKLPEAYRDGVMAYVKALVASVVAADGDEYRALVDQQADRESQMLRDHPAFSITPDDETEAHA